MTSYRATTLIPPLVQRVMDRAARDGFDRSCTPEVGRLLAALGASRENDVLAELGTGYGVGVAWIASTLPATSKLITIDVDAERAAVAARLLTNLPNVQVRHGDWTELLPLGPFGLLFADATASKLADPDLLHGALKPGGMLLVDDLTPEELWPDEWRGKPDEVRDIWLNDERFAACEVRVTASAAVILATRLTER